MATPLVKKTHQHDLKFHRFAESLKTVSIRTVPSNGLGKNTEFNGHMLGHGEWKSKSPELESLRTDGLQHLSIQKAETEVVNPLMVPPM